jgi:DNA-binding response OmpR family regulator
LIVDSEPNLVLSLALSLESEGLRELGTANDGISALEMHEREPYDLILLDNNMPRMRGPEVVRELRRRGDRVPVIMHTAWSREELDLDGHELAAFIPKPYSVSEYMRTVRDVLEKHAMTKTPVAREAGVEGDTPCRSRKSSRRR